MSVGLIVLAVCVSSLVIEEIKKIIKQSEILKYVGAVHTS